MAIVNVLRFNDHAGAMISDEEYWVWGRRRSFFTDHIYRLSEPPLNEQSGMELVYGGTGHPPLHYELTDHLRKRLRCLLEGENLENRPTTTEAVGYLLLEEAQKTVQRRMNNQLQFLYGLSIDDVNRGFFEVENKRYDINQAQIKQDVTNLVKQSGNDESLKLLYKSRGVLIGIDPVFGFSSFFLNYEKSVLAFTSGGFEAIGTGKYASGMAIAQHLNTVPLHQRREGIDPLEGIFTLIHSALSATDSFREVGGYFTLALLEKGKNDKFPRYQSIHGHRAKLASEIVQAWRVDQVSRQESLALLQRLVFEAESVEAVEEALFGAARSRKILEWRLAGFKADVNELESSAERT
jgi:hypothetical protein